MREPLSLAFRRPARILSSRVWGTLLVLTAACSAPHGTPERVIIPVGASFRNATDSLARNGIIHNKAFFRLYARLRGEDRNIRPGTYLVRHGMSWNNVLAVLSDGEGIINRVTIPEGFSIAQITPLLVEQLHVPTDSVDAAVRDSVLRAQLHVTTPTLEGYLFPDTYVFPPGTSARQAVTEMVKRFQRAWKPAYNAEAEKLGVSRNGVMTIASIVEKEAKIPEERPVIAAVYYNRLRIGMPLQADPTVQYALGHHVERVTFKELQVASPYNTYLHAGLPPGPIASPGAASIKAALTPAHVPFLYFVAAPDGHHEFRTTLAGHANATRTVRESLHTARRDSQHPSKHRP